MPLKPVLLGGAVCAAMGLMQAAVIFSIDSDWRYFKGTSEASSPDRAAWRQIGFNDGAWLTGNAAFYYADRGNYTGNTPLTDMKGGYTCIFMRKRFVIANPSDVAQLRLEARCDDGFIAWINGRPWMRYNMPDGDIPYSGASSPALAEPIPYETYFLDNARDYLVTGTNVITIQAFNSSLSASSDFYINASLSSVEDTTSPFVTTIIPPVGATVPSLAQIEIDFSEPVAGVDAADLLIGGIPATNLTAFSPAVYVFQFPPQPAGPVPVAWKTGHGITDLAGTPNLFAGGSWSYTVDPNLPPPGMIISEFMADNDQTLNDIDGEASDWIELRNTDTASANLNGWFLTHTTNNLMRWRIPNVTVAPDGYLVIFASGKNRTNPAAQLHTDFRLAKEGGYLALVNPQGQMVSAFDPGYPSQQTDVSYGRDRFAATLLGYFVVPTPGGPNSSGGPGFAPPVAFSRPGGTFLTSFQLALGTASANAEIRYTLDGSAPTNTSLLYGGPLTVNATTQVRARAYQAGLLPGPPRSEAYLQLSTALANFTSDLPLVVLHNFGAGSVPADVDQPAYLEVFEPGAEGRSSLTNAPELATRVGINLRGRSTQGFPKSSYAVEIWDEGNQDRDESVLGLPAESDWVLYAPNMFDTPLIHDAFIYQLSNDLGRYAPRPRLVEVFVNTTGGALQGPAPSGDYRGVYVLTEKIKRNNDRVAIARLEPEHTQAPQVTGGYLLKIDSADANERALSAAGVTMVYQYPDGLEMVTAQRSAQSNYIRSYFNTFYSALTSPSYTNLTTGYPAYVDLDSWLDHHLLNVLALNADALRLSAYFFKDREGRLEMGPIWDFDRALGTSRGDLRPFNPRSWMASSPLGGGDYGTDFFNPTNTFSNPWYSRMFRDLDFWQRWVDRYQELRTTFFANGYLSGLVDAFAAQLREAQPRELARWQGSGSSDTSPRSGTVSVTGYAHTFPGTYPGEIDFMKRWLGDRVDFMDTNFLGRPTLSRPGGPVSPGTTVTLTGPAGATLYYTMDGSDPRLPGGGLSSRARAYGATLTISTNSRVVARARDLSHANLTGPGKPPLSTPWSGVVAATYVIQTPPLVISEIMYHPSPPPPGTLGLDSELFEYLELLNRGTTSLNLAGFRFTRGIEFTFPSVVLGPGQRIVLAKDVSAFQSRYGTAVAVVGPYLGQLDNAGERLTLEGPLQEPILDFSFDNRWYPITDGHGFSLVVVDSDAALASWAFPGSWRPSGGRLGSPGQPESAAPALPTVWINEALAHTDPPQVDTIELCNPGSVAGDIGGWFLSDDFATPKKYRVPPGTKIPARGFITFSAADFDVPGPNGFLLSSMGDQVYLFSGDVATNLTGYVHGFEFGASSNGVSFGRYLNSVGQEHFVAQTALSLGAANLGPRIGPVVVNEIMYHPPPVFGTNNNTRDEYIELCNISNQPVALFDPNARTNTWHLRGGVSFDFPTNVTLPAGGYLLVVSFDPVLRPGDLATFRSQYGLSPSLPIFGPYEGWLENSGEKVRLLRPDPPQTIPGPDIGQVPYVLAEEIDYLNLAPWPANANASGYSIQRLTSSLYGNDPLNWQGASPTPGGPNRSGTTDTDGDGLPDWWERAFGLNPGLSTGNDGGDGDPDSDGVGNRQEYLASTRPDDPTSFLRFEWIERTAGGVTLQFRAAPGRSYTVLYKNDLSEASWQKLTDVPAPDAFLDRVLTDPAASAARFYRLVSPAQ